MILQPLSDESCVSAMYRHYGQYTQRQTGQFLIHIEMKELPQFTQFTYDHPQGCQDKFSYNALMPRHAFASLIIKFQQFTTVPPYQQVIRSKTYPSYVKPQIILNAIHNVIFV
jgi:hypothetical protein